MGPLGSRLPSRGSAGKALGEMADGEGAAHAPAGGNRGEWLKHETAIYDLRMGDRQPARAPIAAAPQDDVEVEYTRAPAATAPAAEIALDRFQAAKHFGRVEIAFDEGHGIGEIAAGAPMGCVKDDRRGVEQAELLIEPGNGGFHHLRRAAEAAVRPVGADADGVEVLSQTTTVRPEPVEGLPFPFALRTRTVLRQAQDER